MLNEIKTSTNNPIIDDCGKFFKSIRDLAKTIGVKREKISRALKKDGYFNFKDHTYTLFDGKSVNAVKTEVVKEVENKLEDEKEYQEFKVYKDSQKLPFEMYNFNVKHSPSGSKYGIACVSDWHIEECFSSESTMGINEYNTEIAKKRAEKYFSNLVSCINKDGIDTLIVALEGDFFSNYIHPELERTNSMSPLDAQMVAQSLLYSGLKYICDNTKLKEIRAVCLCGNHGRICIKPAHNDFAPMNLEYVMYKNIERECQLTKLPIKFYIPNSEIAIIDMSDGNRFLFTHGQSIRGGNGISGILPSMMRACLKWSQVYRQTKVYCGHFHQILSTPTVSCNGSLIGYNPLSIAGQFSYEKPAQLFEVWSEKLGHIITRRIYCE